MRDRYVQRVLLDTRARSESCRDREGFPLSPSEQWLI